MFEHAVIVRFRYGSTDFGVPFMAGAEVTKQYGPPEDGVREVELEVGS